jgi:hypothetical protein
MLSRRPAYQTWSTDAVASPPLALTGERTLPGIWHENYWLRRHQAAYDVFAPMCAGARVLEAGCGDGYGAARLSAEGARAAPGRGPGDEHAQPAHLPARQRLPLTLFFKSIMHFPEPRASPLVSAPKIKVDHALSGTASRDCCLIDRPRTKDRS